MTHTRIPENQSLKYQKTLLPKLTEDESLWFVLFVCTISTHTYFSDIWNSLLKNYQYYRYYLVTLW